MGGGWGGIVFGETKPKHIPHKTPLARKGELKKGNVTMKHTNKHTNHAK